MSMQAIVETRPPRVRITRVDDPTVELEAQFNPTELTETGGTEWGRQQVPGLSHKVKQFSNTKDRQEKIKLRFIANAYPSDGAAKLKQARDFILSSCNVKALPGSIRPGGAPRLLFLWPNLFSMVCIIDSYSIVSERFFNDGQLADMTIELTLEQIRDTLITSDDDPNT